MHIRQLLEGLNVLSVKGPEDIPAEGLCIDSRKLSAGDAFLCLKGTLFDSHTLAPSLYEQGVRVFLCEEDLPLPGDALVVRLPDMRRALSRIAQNFYRRPAEEMTLIGITGSKGKTTVAHMLFTLLDALGESPGLLGTNGAKAAGRTFPLTNTTPEPLELQRTLREMADLGTNYVVMEISSQAMKLHRIDGMQFDLGLFLNIEEGDHVGPLEHESFAEYLACKKAFLPLCRQVLIWSGEPRQPELTAGLTSVFTYGREPGADFRLVRTAPTFLGPDPGMELEAAGALEGVFTVRSLGEVGALNALASLASLKLLHLDPWAAAPALNTLSVTGRMEWIYRSPDYSVLIDFAHNGLSARSVLQALREYRPQRLVCLFGVNGSRDIQRRRDMGFAAGTFADLSIITEGHNRAETFEDILPSILEGMHEAGGEHLVIPERKNALQWAIEHRKPGDILAILGLGHEEYLEKKGVRHPHSDRQIVLELLEEAEPSEDF